MMFWSLATEEFKMSIEPYLGWILVLLLIVFMAIVVSMHLLLTLKKKNEKSDKKLKLMLILTPLVMISLYLFVLRPGLYGFLLGFYKACPTLPGIDGYADLTLSILFIAAYVLLWQDQYYRTMGGK